MAKRMVFPVAGGDALVHYAILIVHEAILSYVKLQVANGSRHGWLLSSGVCRRHLTADGPSCGPI